MKTIIHPLQLKDSTKKMKPDNLRKKLNLIISHNPNDEWYDEKKHRKEAVAEIMELLFKSQPIRRFVPDPAEGTPF